MERSEIHRPPLRSGINSKRKNHNREMIDSGLSVSNRKNRIAEAAGRIGALRCLFLLYILFILFQMVFNGYCKHIETYDDEWLYYGIAESLVKGMGFPAIYGEKYELFNRYIYCFLIAPGLLASNRLLQFRLVAVLNAAMIGSGAFPVFFLSKRVLKNDWHAYLAGMIYLLQPDMEFAATLMTENIWLPVTLLVIWLFYELINEENSSLQRQFLISIFLFASMAVLVFIKDSGVPIVISLGLYYFIFMISKALKKWRTRNDDSIKTENRKVWWVVSGVFLCLVLIGLIFFNSSKDIIGYVIAKKDAVSSAFEVDPGRYVWCYCYTWATEILALGIFPFILPLFSFRKLSKAAKRLFGIALLLTFIANFGIAITSLGTTDSFQMPDFRLHQRYVIYLWILYMIVYIYVMTHEIQLSLIKVGMSVLATALFCVRFQGAVIGSSVDTSLLLWTLNWMDHRKRWSACVILFVCVGLLLLVLRFKRVFCCYFICVMAVVVVYDHQMMHSMIEGPYRFDYSKVRETELFIRDHEDDQFLVVTLPNTINVEDVHLNAKVADTYLVYPNTEFVSGKKITGIQTAHGIDLSDIDKEDLGISIMGPCGLDEVDYIVLTTEMTLDPAMGELVVEGEYFNIYRLHEKTKIPYMKYRNTWLQPGETTFQPEAGFFSNYTEGEDEMCFISGGHPDYVLYGPYTTLKPGRYDIAIHYTYSGDEDGKIGRMDLNGSAIESSDLKTDVYTNRDTVSLSFDVTEPCDNFEVRLFAEVPGIQVESVDIRMQGLNIVEMPGMDLCQLSGPNGLLMREEYYSKKGEKVSNTSGYHAVDYSYQYGDRIGCSYYDVEEHPVNISSGYASAHYTYDRFRQLIREEYYDKEGEPVCSSGFYAVEYDRDANGDPVEIRYYDEVGERITLSSGVSIIRRTYNEARQIIREEYYDEEDERVMCSDGYSAMEYSYDEAGNIIEYRYYDLEDNLTNNSSDFAILRRSFNEARQLIRNEYYDLTDEPVTRKDGYFAVEYEYDDAGNIAEYRYFDPDRKLTLTDNGYAILRRDYNDNRQIVQESYFDKEEKPVERKEGYNIVQYQYDEIGNTTEYRYYGTDGELTLTENGYAIIRRDYNDRRKIVQDRYYDSDDTPVECKDGFSSIRYQYDEIGNTEEYRYYGLDGELTLTENEYAIRRKEYNKIRQVTQECYYDKEGQPVLNKDGYQEVEYSYDSKGHVIEERYYGLDHEMTDTLDGYACIVRTYDENSTLVEEKGYSVDGTEVDVPDEE